jgi:serine/threonine protein kinase
MLLGKKIGPYLIEKELGSGAMGAVYRGRNVDSGERVAIKIIALGLAGNENAMRRFQREIDILRQLEHPNIARIIRSGKYHETPLYVMEYLEGESLDKALARRGRLSWEEVVSVGRQLCAALRYAHERGIIHRDLKPGNLMILKDGTIKLTDFGIAKDTDVTALTADNSTVGTAAYMSPEQCKGTRGVTAKSDLYSMGVMFYELLTGTKPFVADNIIEMFRLHTQGTFERPSRRVLEVPIWLDTLVCQLLEKQPEKRPLNAAIVAESLQLVQAKWEQQKSAGVEAASKRKIDKATVEGKFDETDKEMARALLGKKKKKKKALPFYRKGWFTLLIVLLALAGLGYGGYQLFFKPPDPDQLFATLETQVEAKDYHDRQKAVDMIESFLRWHPDHPRAAQAREYRDLLQFEQTEYTTHKRRGNPLIGAQNDQEKLAWAALDDEDIGKLEPAERSWKELAMNKTADDLQLRGWGLLAVKSLQEIDAVRKLLEELKGRIERAEDFKTLLEKADPNKALALEAIKAEKDGAQAKALIAWEDLKKISEGRERRRWYMLAAWQARELAARK